MTSTASRFRKPVRAFLDSSSRDDSPTKKSVADDDTRTEQAGETALIRSGLLPIRPFGFVVRIDSP
jgi:hypothetical protein